MTKPNHPSEQELDDMVLLAQRQVEDDATLSRVLGRIHDYIMRLESENKAKNGLLNSIDIIARKRIDPDDFESVWVRIHDMIQKHWELHDD